MMMSVGILQVLINSSAIVVIGLIFISFNKEVFKTVRHLAAAHVGILQVLINYCVIFGIGLFWIGFNNEVFKMVNHIVAVPFSLPKKKDNSQPKKKDNSSIDCSGGEARTKIPEPPPFYIS
jgi:uncharacterized membrane protein YqhA